ncbi:MAG TPA: hypothetical protein VF557_03510 [Jatrophihabitans sp.]|jgi:hypothetical protein|uniref:hypothetical protein n=1 Tax=Jatrophihabitans sp. TaxID=1932789 RepID=UPI002F163142
MLLDRRSVLAVALLSLSLAVAGCDSSRGDSAQQQTSRVATTASASLSAPLPSPASSSPPAGSAAASNPAAGTTAAGSPATSTTVAGTTAPRPPASAVNVGASLCTGADIAQNTADAYMGALSANDAQQASACVLPNTVPATLTRSLLASASTTAVYLPRDGVDGPSVFGYRGSGKMVDVTVSKQPDGRFWVTEVVVLSG